MRIPSHLIYRDVTDGPRKVLDVPTLENPYAEDAWVYPVEAQFSLTKLLKRMKAEDIKEMKYEGPLEKEIGGTHENRHSRKEIGISTRILASYSRTSGARS